MKSLIAGLLLLLGCGTAESDDMGMPPVLDLTRARRHCDISKDPLNLPDQICRERLDPPASFDSFCLASGGVVRDGICPKAGAQMGCIVADGMAIDWWYQGGKEQASRRCFLSEGILISPRS